MKNSVFISHSSEETKRLASRFAETLCGGSIVCLMGNLGSGKTTFAQGLLETFGAEKPYTSPTFLIMKEYALSPVYTKDCSSKSENRLLRIVHIDAYRISEKDILELGWSEIVNDTETMLLIEWPERIQSLIPNHAKWIQFEWTEENVRAITFLKPTITS